MADKDTPNDEGGNGRNGSKPDSRIGGLWLLFAFAIVPIVLAVLIPSMPSLVHRIERLKIGGFEATLTSERLSAGAATTGAISEQASPEVHFELLAWSKFGAVLDRHHQILTAAGLLEPKQETSINDFKDVQRRLVEPLAVVLDCQVRSQVGVPESIRLVDEMIVILRHGSRFAGLRKENAARAATDQRSREYIGRVIRSVRNLEETVTFGSSDDCLVEKRDAFSELCRVLGDLVPRSHAAPDERDVIVFRDGYLSVFVATLIAARDRRVGRGPDNAIRSLDATLRRTPPPEKASATRFAMGGGDGDAMNAMERVNIHLAMGRWAQGARWDAEIALGYFERARNIVGILRSELKTRRESMSDHPGCCGGETMLHRLRDVDEQADYLKNSVRPFILTSLLAVINQYRLEGIPVQPHWMDDAERWRTVLARLTERWVPEPDDALAERPQRALANATSNVAMFNLLNAEREEGLTGRLCAETRASMDAVVQFWHDLETRHYASPADSFVGIHQAPLVLAQKYRGYAEAICDKEGY